MSRGLSLNFPFESCIFETNLTLEENSSKPGPTNSWQRQDLMVMTKMSDTLCAHTRVFAY